MSLELLYFLLNFSQELPTTAFSLVLLREFHVSAAQFNEIDALWYMTGILHPLWAFLSDQVPLMGKRRKHYLVLASLTTFVSGFLLGPLGVTTSLYAFVGVSMLTFMAQSMAETVVDCMAVELGNLGDTKAALQSKYMTMRTLGSMSGAALSVGLLEVFSSRSILLFSSFGFLLTAGIAVGMSEDNPSLSTQKVKRLRVGAKILWAPLLFVFIYSTTPSSEDTYYASLTFDDWQMSLSTFIGFLGSLTGSLLYWTLFTKWNGLINVFVAVTMIGVIGNLSPLLLVLGVSRGLPITCWIAFVTSLVSTLSVLPVLVLASSCAPRRLGLEGSMFSLFATTQHLGQLIAAVAATKLTEALRLDLLIIVCAGAGLLPLIFAKSLLHSSTEHSLLTEPLIA